MSTQPPQVARTLLLGRLQALLDALRDGPLTQPALFQRLGSAYPATSSVRRMVARDLEYLASLGIVIERSQTKPLLYTLRGGALYFSTAELRTLALVRDTFGPHHPQAAEVQALLKRLTLGLGDAGRHDYKRRQVLRAPLQPAIDYSPYADLIARIEEAISDRKVVAFHYRARGAPRSVLHRKVEPYEIEYYERHFYLVAFTHNSRQFHDFRIDRIEADSFDPLYAGNPPPKQPLLTFRYRLAAALAEGGVSQRFATQRVVEQLPNGDLVIEAQGRNAFFIRRTLLKYAHNAELLSPDWLRQELAEEVARLASLYSSPVDS